MPEAFLYEQLDRVSRMGFLNRKGKQEFLKAITERFRDRILTFGTTKTQR